MAAKWLDAFTCADESGGELGNENKFKAKAVQCFALAARTAYPDIAAQYLQLGSAYERLANWKRHRAAIEGRLKSKLGKLGAYEGTASRPN